MLLLFGRRWLAEARHDSWSNKRESKVSPEKKNHYIKMERGIFIIIFYKKKNIWFLSWNSIKWYSIYFSTNPLFLQFFPLRDRKVFKKRKIIQVNKLTRKILDHPWMKTINHIAKSVRLDTPIIIASSRPATAPYESVHVNHEPHVYRYLRHVNTTWKIILKKK